MYPTQINQVFSETACLYSENGPQFLTAAMFQVRPPIVFMYVLEIGSLLITVTWPSKTDTMNVSFERVRVPRIYPFRSKVRSSHTMRCESWIIVKLYRFQTFHLTKCTKEAVEIHWFQNFMELLFKEVKWVSIGWKLQQYIHDTAVQECSPTYTLPRCGYMLSQKQMLCLVVWISGVCRGSTRGTNYYCYFPRIARQTTITRLDTDQTQPL